MKVLFVFNHPAPYKVLVYNELIKLLDIEVIFEREYAKDRPNDFYAANKYNFPVTFLKDGYFSNENSCSSKLAKYIRNNHEKYDAIVMNGYSTFAEMKAIRYMIRHHIPYILQINGGIIKKDNFIKKILKKYYISHAAKYFSPCTEADKYLIHYGANKEMIFHYPYGNYFNNEIIQKPLSESEKKTIREKWNLPSGRLFVNASQFIERKNNFELISIFKDRPENLLLIGSGKEQEKYERFIKDNNINNIFILSFQKKKELFEILSSADCFITLSSEDIFGHTTVEAMANGLPVISSDRVVSSIDLIKDGLNGFLVDINNREMINRAIDDSKNLQHEEAIKTAANNTVEKSAAKLKELLEKEK